MHGTARMPAHKGKPRKCRSSKSKLSSPSASPIQLLFLRSLYRYPSSFTVSLPRRNPRYYPKSFILFKASATPDQNPNSNPDSRPSADPPKPKGRRSKPKSSAGGTTTAASGDVVPSKIPRKPRRGRQSEAAAVEDFIQDRLEGTFTLIQEQNTGSWKGKRRS